MSALESNKVGMAIFFKSYKPWHKRGKGTTLVLDGINDPGNLGTIIRTADWYGVRTIIASESTVDAYNPKVIMASMGSMTRVTVLYKKLETYLAWVTWPVLGAYLEWDDLHVIDSFPKNLHLIIGSESHGISSKISEYITQKITIPRFGWAESLNAGIATAVILDNLMRKSQ
jgi:TrmH family RNA methyltransferase